MSAAGELLDALTAVGARVELTGNRLVLRAGARAIPADLVRRFREVRLIKGEALLS